MIPCVPDTSGTEMGELGILGRGLAKAEEKASHIMRVLRIIRALNQLMVNETDPLRLIEVTCTTLTETMGYENAWIAATDETPIYGDDDGQLGLRRRF